MFKRSPRTKPENATWALCEQPPVCCVSRRTRQSSVVGLVVGFTDTCASAQGPCVITSRGGFVILGRHPQRECGSRRGDDTRGDSSLGWVCASKVHDSTQTSCPAHGAAQMHAHCKRTPLLACWGASGRGCVPQAHGPWLSHTHPSAPRRGGVLDSEWWRLGRCGARGPGGPTRRGGPAREAPFFVFLRPRVALAVGALIIAGKRLGLLRIERPPARVITRPER